MAIFVLTTTTTTTMTTRPIAHARGVKICLLTFSSQFLRSGLVCVPAQEAGTQTNVSFIHAGSESTYVSWG